MQRARMLSLTIAATHIVLGLQWQPVVGRRPDRQARRQARQQQASHLVLAGDPVSAFGLAWMDSLSALDSKPMHSAAYSFSQLFPGETVAMIKDLGEQGYWLVAAHEGLVIAGTDSLYLSNEQARSELQTLYQAYPQLQHLDGNDAPGMALLAASVGVRSVLLSTSVWRCLRSRSAQLAAFLLIAFAAWGWWLHGAEREANRPVVQNIDSRSAWKTAIRNYERGRYLHGAGPTYVVLKSLGALPVHITGWALKTAQCAPHEQGWQCQADYERGRTQATYNDFLSAVPASWTSSFPDLHRAQSRWRFDADAPLLEQQWVSSVRENERMLLSSLQRMQSAFVRMEIGPSTLVTITPPLDNQGLPISRPNGLSRYAQRRVLISGPLRSASLLLPHVAAMSWRRVALVLQEQDAPDLRRSRLIFTLEGTLYETDDATYPPRQ